MSLAEDIINPEIYVSCIVKVKEGKGRQFI